MTPDASAPSALSYVAGAMLVTLAVFLGYWMRGGDVGNDARLEHMQSMNEQLAELNAQVRILLNEDKTYWNGYSEGLTACYNSHQ